MSRLDLNFQLQTDIERVAEAKNAVIHLKGGPSPAEAETIASYILWGKGSDGLSPQQRHEIELKPWHPRNPVESLDYIPEEQLQLATFKSKSKKTPFSREDALSKCDPEQQKIFQDLFHEIDITAATIAVYAAQGTGKCGPALSENAAKGTKKTIEEVLAPLSEEDIAKVKTNAAHLNYYKYLKLRHQLVDLRTQQYIYADMFLPKQQPHPQSRVMLNLDESLDFELRPVPMIDSKMRQKVWNLTKDIDPSQFNEEEKEQISHFLWEDSRGVPVVDLTNIDIWYELLENFSVIKDLAAEAPFDSPLPGLVLAMNYYLEKTSLTEVRREILNAKIAHKSNQYILQTFNLNHNVNYISTIYCRQILPAICDTVRQHREILENLFFPENFKKCKGCGRILLINNDNFTRQKKSKDGYMHKCKVCQKLSKERLLKGV